MTWQPIETANHGEMYLVGRSGSNMVAQAFYHGLAWRHAHSLDKICFVPTHCRILPRGPDTPDPRDTILAKMAEALKVTQQYGLYFHELEGPRESAARYAAERTISAVLAEYEAWSGAKGENEGG